MSQNMEHKKAKEVTHYKGLRFNTENQNEKEMKIGKEKLKNPK